MCRLYFLTFLFFLASLGIPAHSFPQRLTTGNINFGAVHIDQREGIDLKFGARLSHSITSRISIEGSFDWVNLETLVGPEDRLDYDALYYSAIMTYDLSETQSVSSFIGSGFGATTFLLHDVFTTNEGTDTKPMIPIVIGIQWLSNSGSSPGIRLDIRDNVTLGNEKGLVDEALSTSHAIEVSVGVLFSL